MLTYSKGERFGMSFSHKVRLINGLIVGLSWVTMVGCATTPPGNPHNLCAIFQEKHGWYTSTKQSFDKWGVPIHVQMAIIYQESGFRSKAKPPRKWLLGLIPLSRPSSAYGYSQATKGTWNWYIRATGNSGAARHNFADAVDFIGWYGEISHTRLGISKWDTYNQYLAYHEGHGGYASRRYRHKRWLIETARRVEANARRYRGQLATCEADLDKGRWWWPF